MRPEGGLDAFVVCAPGLEALLAGELAGLGLSPGASEAGGVHLSMNASDLPRLLLGCGLGLDVRVRLESFEARHFSTLEKRARRIAWADVLPSPAAWTVTARCRKSKLYHSGGVEQRVADAVERALGSAEPGAPSVDVHVRVLSDICTVSVSAAGVPLHKRGYRKAAGKAPLREDLARALLLAAGWPSTDGVLFDPLCGSGTLLIEGALLAMKRAPGLRRGFAAESWPRLADGSFASARDRALEAETRWTGPFIGADRDAGAVQMAEGNAERAHVEVEVMKASVSESAASVRAGTSGLWASNPPYGSRISAGRDLRPLYQTIGRLFRDLPDAWSLALCTSDARLAAATRVRFRSPLLTEHGGLQVGLFISSERDAQP